MRSREIANILFSKSGLSNSQYAKLLGISRAALWDRINTMKAKDMTVSVFSEMVNALGYYVVVTQNPAKDVYIVD